MGVLLNDPMPAIAIAGTGGPEGDTGQRDLGFEVSLDIPTDDTVMVSYATADGTATAPADYAARSGTLTFAPGETHKQLRVPLNGDTQHEPTESFTVTLSAPSEATISDATATGTIENDDSVITPPGPRQMPSAGDLQQDPAAPTGSGPPAQPPPKSPAGPVATIRCPRASLRKVGTTCTVTYARPKSAKLSTARLTRNGEVHARGKAAGARPLRLHVVRPLRPGRYTLTIVTVDGRGRRSTVRRKVTIG